MENLLYPSPTGSEEDGGPGRIGRVGNSTRENLI